MFYEYSRKILQQAKLSIFWNMEYSPIFQRTAITTKSATLIFLFFFSIILYLSWNFPKLCLNMILFQFLEQGIFQKKGNKINIEIGGIWNIRGIFLKNCKTIKITKILEYGLFHEIFQEYSKNWKTSHGGVKFNQAPGLMNFKIVRGAVWYE